MRKSVRVRVAAGLSLLFTYVFFCEYLPPLKRARIPYDLHGYHYPLANYAFHALGEGRFPQWDAAIYSGTSFVGNVQTALFYPPTWLLFAANMGRPGVSYQSMQDFVFAHVWLGFLLCFLWLRRKGLQDLPSALGAGIFAFSGYACLQLQHLGLIAGYAWMPLGLWGIDEAVDQRRWQPLWKVAAASALCFLAGYVPTWVVFAVCMLCYAGWRWKALAGTGAALAASLLLCMVQLLPTLEIAALKPHEDRYGSGLEVAPYLLGYLLPNFNNSTGVSYLYLGGAGTLGLLCLAASRRRREALPLLFMLAVVVMIATNPGDLVWQIVRRFPAAAQVIRDWYFLAGVTLAVAPLAALGLDAALARVRRPLPPWLGWSAAGLAAAWAARLLTLRSRGQLAAGWRSGIDAVAALALCGLAVYLLPAQSGRVKKALAAALLLLVATEYQVFGTGREFNASREGPPDYRLEKFPGLDDATYARIRAHPEYRIAVDETGPFATDLRHFRLTTPQGFDPFLTTQYIEMVRRVGMFRTDREFELDLDNLEGLKLLGVRYLITTERGSYFPRLANNPHFRRIGEDYPAFRVFEFLDARLPYGYVAPNPRRTLRRVQNSPERRVFEVSSPEGGWFSLAEQYFPGWEARVDGAPVPIERWEGAFQAIFVSAGRHRVEFRYSSPGFRVGAAVSLLALTAAAVLALREVRAHRRDGLARRGDA